MRNAPWDSNLLQGVRGEHSKDDRYARVGRCVEHPPRDGADDGIIVGGGTLDLLERDQRVGRK